MLSNANNEQLNKVNLTVEQKLVVLKTMRANNWDQGVAARHFTKNMG
jgi:hypothetical protein